MQIGELVKAYYQSAMNDAQLLKVGRINENDTQFCFSAAKVCSCQDST